MIFETLIRAIYPPLCVACSAETQSEDGLCADCWPTAHFLSGLLCDACACPLVGEEEETSHCDACRALPPSWSKGRAVFLYEGAGRRVAMNLKHADRLDLARPLAKWMTTAGEDILTPDSLLIPVPLHWRRMLKRKYNQAAVVAQQISKRTKCPLALDGLKRTKATSQQKGMSREARFANQADAIVANPKRMNLIKGRSITLIDDVMTTGATLSACAEACKTAGAERVDVLILARVARPE